MLIVRMAKVVLFILIYGKAENDKKKKKITYKVTYKWKLWKNEKKKIKQFERKGKIKYSPVDWSKKSGNKVMKRRVEG